MNNCTIRKLISVALVVDLRPKANGIGDMANTSGAYLDGTWQWHGIWKGKLAAKSK